MYGGGFATVPAYLADLFGTQMVGAIHGRLLTAWATAGILGPVVVNYMRDYQLSLGVPREQVYNQTMFILVALLAIGFVCNLLIRPVDPKFFMSDDALARERLLAREKALADRSGTASTCHIAVAGGHPGRHRRGRMGCRRPAARLGALPDLAELGQILPVDQERSTRWSARARSAPWAARARTAGRRCGTAPPSTGRSSRLVCPPEVAPGQ